MRTFEVICITIGLIPLPLTVVAALLGDESAPVSAGLTFALARLASATLSTPTAASATTRR